MSPTSGSRYAATRLRAHESSCIRPAAAGPSHHFRHRDAALCVDAVALPLLAGTLASQRAFDATGDVSLILFPAFSPPDAFTAAPDSVVGDKAPVDERSTCRDESGIVDVRVKTKKLLSVPLLDRYCIGFREETQAIILGRN